MRKKKKQRQENLFSRQLLAFCKGLLLNADKKNGERDGSRHKGEARSEPEQSEGNPIKESNPVFASAKMNGEKEKATAGKLVFQAVACFLQRITLERGQKKWRERRDSNPQHPP